MPLVLFCGSSFAETALGKAAMLPEVDTVVVASVVLEKYFGSWLLKLVKV